MRDESRPSRGEAAPETTPGKESEGQFTPIRRVFSEFQCEDCGVPDDGSPHGAECAARIALERDGIAEGDDEKSFTANDVAEWLSNAPDDLVRHAMGTALTARPALEAELLFPGVDGRLTTGAYNALLTLQERDAAAEAFRRLRNPPVPPPPVVPLADFLAAEDGPLTYRVEELWPTEGRVLIAAQHKAGKTTLVANLIRSLADGEPFMERFLTAQADRILLVDNESPDQYLRDRLGGVAIQNTAAVNVMSLRGRTGSFNILDPQERRTWAERLGAADVLVFDCLRPVLDALGLSEDKDAGRFLVALDALAYEAGIGEVILVHHTGHEGVRSRGDSRILDWPDAVWTLRRADPEDEASPRFFKAYGRVVDFSESLLGYDAPTHRLSIVGGSRATVKHNAIREKIVDYVRAQPGCPKGQLEKALGGNSNEARAAIDALVAEGVLRRVDGPNRSKLHYLQEDPDDDLI